MSSTQKQRTRKPRERVRDMPRMRNMTARIIARVSIEHLSHADMLDMRAEMFARDEWKRLPAYAQQELIGMFRGAEQAWHACGAIVWTHTLQDGSIHLSPLPSIVSYETIESSAHRWAADLSCVWYAGSQDKDRNAGVAQAAEAIQAHLSNKPV